MRQRNQASADLPVTTIWAWVLAADLACWYAVLLLIERLVE